MVRLEGILNALTAVSYSSAEVFHRIQRYTGMDETQIA